MFSEKTPREKIKEQRAERDQLQLENEMLRDRATTLKKQINDKLKKELGE